MNKLLDTIKKTIEHQVYLLQLENYDVERYPKVIQKASWKPKESPRKNIEWTPKLKAVLGIGCALHTLVAIVIGYVFMLLGNYSIGATAAGIVMTIIAWVGLVPFFFLDLIAGVFLISPLDKIMKQKIIQKAKKKLEAHTNLKVIGITGSYGKTTMKEILAAILSEKFIILKTPENINTPIGIARLILNKLTPDVEVLIVEMGAYRPGDIKELCELTPPDISIVTGINESHLERFKTIENTIKTKFEIVTSAKKDAIAVLNADNAYMKQSYKNFTDDKPVYFYSSENSPLAYYRVNQKELYEDGSGIFFDVWKDEECIGGYRLPLLGEYVIGAAMGAVIIAKKLGFSEVEIKQGMVKLRPIKHRLEPIQTANGVLVIDDSYNGNPEGVKEAIKLLGRFKKKRKIYITPGLVEMGEKTKEIHETIGKELAKVADGVILIKNSVTPYVSESLETNGFKKENIIWCASIKEAHAILPKIIHTGDVVLFQNDWPENYT